MKKDLHIKPEEDLISLEVFRKAGKKGGTQTFKKKGASFMSEIGSKGSKQRWDKEKDKIASLESVNETEKKV